MLLFTFRPWVIILNVLVPYGIFLFRERAKARGDTRRHKNYQNTWSGVFRPRKNSELATKRSKQRWEDPVPGFRLVYPFMDRYRKQIKPYGGRDKISKRKKPNLF